MADEPLNPDAVRAKLYDFVSDPMNRHNPELGRARRLLGTLSKSQASEAVAPQPKPPAADVPTPIQAEPVPTEAGETTSGAVNSAADRFSGGLWGNVLNSVAQINNSPIGRKVNAVIGEGESEHALKSMENYRAEHPVASVVTDVPGYLGGLPEALGGAVRAPIERGIQSVAGSKAVNDIVHRAVSGHGLLTPLTALVAQKLAPAIARTVPSTMDAATRVLPPIIQAFLAAREGQK